MKHSSYVNIILQRVRAFPLVWLSFSREKRLFIVAISYVLGIVGLWYLFPLTHNGATMYLPIMSACWLFRYRGMFSSLFLNGVAFQLVYLMLLKGLLSDQDFIEGAAIGFSTSLGLGVVICWLRTAVDQVQSARRKVQLAEQERFDALQAEQRVILAYEHQRKLNEMKEQFLFQVSHELRTPLTVLGGSLEVLKELSEQLDPMERSRMLTRALSSHEALVKVVDGILDAAAISGGSLQAQCEGVSIYQVLREVLDHFDPRDVGAYTICMLVPEQILVWADRQFLYRVLQNLFSNIFKYVPAQTVVNVEARQEAASAPIYLSVQDAGPGIPPDELPLLFEKFVRLKRDLAGTTRGTGLGLSICKSLVEAMGGRIWAESSGRAGEGSRICITLPAFPFQEPVGGSLS